MEPTGMNKSPHTTEEKTKRPTSRSNNKFRPGKSKKNVRPDFDGEFDYKIGYSDEYYEEYINGFKTNEKNRLFYRFIKRTFDIIASLILIVLLAIPMLIIAVIIRCDSEGGAIFKGERIGRNGKKFKCYKFRTMRIDAPRDCPTSLLDHPEQYQTKVGRTLRRLSIDELPQLYCVFIGTMSFIGYRPLVPKEQNCNEMRKRLGVFAMRPGISGYSQVHGRDNVYYKNKAIMDAQYVKHASVWLDVKLMFQTIYVVLKREGNASEAEADNKKSNKKTAARNKKQSKRQKSRVKATVVDNK